MKTALILVLALAVLVAGSPNKCQNPNCNLKSVMLQALGGIEDSDIAKERVKVSASISHSWLQI